MSDERRDIFGSLLKVGDEVAYDPPYYKGLVIGRIVRFTPKGVVVERKKIDKEGNVSYLGRCNRSIDGVIKNVLAQTLTSEYLKMRKNEATD